MSKDKPHDVGTGGEEDWPVDFYCPACQEKHTLSGNTSDKPKCPKCGKLLSDWPVDFYCPACQEKHTLSSDTLDEPKCPKCYNRLDWPVKF